MLTASKRIAEAAGASITEDEGASV